MPYFLTSSVGVDCALTNLVETRVKVDSRDTLSVFLYVPQPYVPRVMPFLQYKNQSLVTAITNECSQRQMYHLLNRYV